MVAGCGTLARLDFGDSSMHTFRLPAFSVLRLLALLAAASLVACSTSDSIGTATPAGTGTDAGVDGSLSGADSTATADAADIATVDAQPTADATPVVDPPCPSGKMWKGGENSMMRPGEDCIACHKKQKGPTFVIAGTIYPTEHAVDDCNGTKAVTVEITGADGKVTKATSNSAGNFYITSSVKLPYTALIRQGDLTREMLKPQTVGSCNSCHTQDGANDAPGRIQAP